ncbi:hypothetical protein CC2G_012342 [Coprinopsis cinerea AmutBmut pab1-1]|nr:hypothetical protein CC2G_012342 [Coprinopsis cinerea AmutBmut pab1-1]
MQLKNLAPFLAIALSVIGGTNAQGQSYILPWYGGQWCNDQTIVGLAIADAPTGGCRLIRSTTNGAHNVHSFAANGAGRFNIRVCTGFGCDGHCVWTGPVRPPGGACWNRLPHEDPWRSYEVVWA